MIRAIAQAFEMPFEDVWLVAGGPEAAETDTAGPNSERGDASTVSLTLRELWGIVKEMPIEDQRAVLDYALFRRSRNDEPPITWRRSR